MKTEIKAFRELSSEPDIRCWINVDEKGNVTSQYSIIERQNDCAMLVPLKEYMKMTGTEPFPMTDFVSVGTQYDIYKKILVKAAEIRGDSPESVHIVTSEERYYALNKEKIELEKAVETEKKEKRIKKERKKTSELLSIAKKTNKPQIIHRYSEECDGSVDSCDIDNILVYIKPDGSQFEERHHCY